MPINMNCTKTYNTSNDQLSLKWNPISGAAYYIVLLDVDYDSEMQVRVNGIEYRRTLNAHERQAEYFSIRVLAKNSKGEEIGSSQTIDLIDAVQRDMNIPVTVAQDVNERNKVNLSFPSQGINTAYEINVLPSFTNHMHAEVGEVSVTPARDIVRASIWLTAPGEYILRIGVKNGPLKGWIKDTKFTVNNICPNPVKNIRYSKSAGKINVSWEATPTADYYYVQFGTYHKTHITSSNQLSVSMDEAPFFTDIVVTSVKKARLKFPNNSYGDILELSASAVTRLV